MSILHILSADNFITVNRRIAEIVGLEAAVIFGELASESLYWQQNNPEGNGWFFSTVENLEKKTFLSAHSQRIALIKLQEQGWIEVEKRGMPAKRFIRMKEDKITEVINNKSLKILTTSDEKNERQVVENFNGNKNIDKKNIEKRIEVETDPEDREGHAFLNKPVEREDIEYLVHILTAAYPYSKKKIDTHTTIDLWTTIFRETNANNLYRAVRNHIESCAYFPTITEIQSQLKRIYLTTLPEPKKEPESQQTDPAKEDRIDDILADLAD